MSLELIRTNPESKISVMVVFQVPPRQPPQLWHSYCVCFRGSYRLVTPWSTCWTGVLFIAGSSMDDHRRDRMGNVELGKKMYALEIWAVAQVGIEKVQLIVIVWRDLPSPVVSAPTVFAFFHLVSFQALPVKLCRCRCFGLDGFAYFPRPT